LKIFTYSISFIIVVISITVILLMEKNKMIKDHTFEIKENHRHQVESIIIQYKNSSEFIFNSIVNQKDVLELQSNALFAITADKRDMYRKDLYNKLSLFYASMKELGVKQMHFHFPDTTSFLRFHKPSKYGDSLKDIRYSVLLANNKMKKVTGFEEGRIFNGYRFVYPLIYNKKHIGSVEISVGFNAIQKISKLIYNTHQYMILHKDIIENKVFSGEKQNYARSDLDDNFYHESNNFVNYSRGVRENKEIISFEVFNKINKELKKVLIKKELDLYRTRVKYIKINDKYYFISFLPIINVKKERIGYIISYGVSEKYDEILSDYNKKIFIIILILSLVFLSVFRADISRQRLNELSQKERDSALESSKAKSEFLANMSHEIRTPLNAILGFIDLLKEEKIGGKSSEYVDIIKNSSTILLKIIEDILDFSKIESGKLDIDKIDFNTKAEFEVIIHLFQAKSSQKNISLVLNLDKNIPQIINTDPLRVKQVITNLLSNAVKFTSDSKTIIVDISYDNKFLNVSVKDEGIGISEDKLTHIFEAFGQEDSSTTRKYGGTGLGLSISSELVKLLGGELKVKSKVGVGSEFYFSIPVGVGKELKTEDYNIEQVNFQNRKILLVEDNKANQMFMKIVLNKLGLTFDIANDGLEAIEAFKENQYDLILMDENMPNLNGMEATKRILSIEKEQSLKHTPIVALTANSLKGDREKFLKAGLDEYLTKPIDKKKLREVLSGFFKMKEDI
jgi:signal transduction histidine kinase/CheY-like chemotaxis protein